MTKLKKKGNIRALFYPFFIDYLGEISWLIQHKQKNASASPKKPAPVTPASVPLCVKVLLRTIEGGDKSAMQAVFIETSSALDRAARKGLIHKNKAARLKSRLSARIKAVAA